MADPQIKPFNRFFLTREHPNGINDPYICTRTHLPRKFSIEDALVLAADLIRLAGGREAAEPYLKTVVDESPEAVTVQALPEIVIPDMNALENHESTVVG